MERWLGSAAFVSIALAASGCGVDERTPGVVDAMSQDMEFRGNQPALPDAPGRDGDRVAETSDGGPPLGDAAPADGSPSSRTDAGAPPPDMSVAVPADPLLTRFSATPLPGDEPDCLVSNRRIAGKDDAQSVYVRGGAYLGWAEWREGTYGSCEGAQWIRFHLQLALPAPLELRYLVDDGVPTAVGYAWPEGLPGRVNSTDAEVIHDGPILRDSRVICALLAIPTVPRAQWPVFGLYNQQVPLQNLIEGTLC
jgi:hypothetical protein